MKSKLIQMAATARASAYAPYSNFKVGAALLCCDGTIFTGFNVENKSYPASMCAERTALYNAIANGKRDFKAIAVIGSSSDPCFPCGICLQTLSEFCGNDFVFYICSENGECTEKKLGDLLPFTFSL